MWEGDLGKSMLFDVRFYQCLDSEGEAHVTFYEYNKMEKEEECVV